MHATSTPSEELGGRRRGLAARSLRRRASTALLSMVGCALTVGCKDVPSDRADRAPSDAPRLVLIDSVTLRETDSSYVAEPGDLAIGPAGSFLVADRFAKRVQQFGRTGEFRGKFGRSGEGPGEFELPGYLAVDGDTLLYAADVTGVEMFDLRTYAHRGFHRTPRMVGVMALAGDRLFAGLADPVQHGSIARIESDSAKLSVTGPFPELLRNEALFPMFYPVALGIKGDTAATAYNVTADLYLTTLAGQVLDSIPVPARRRHGVDRDVLLRFSKNVTDQKLGEAAVYGTSLPLDLHWMPNGNIALLTGDWKVVDGRFVTVHYLSVIDPRARRSCVDARIPGPTDPPVRMTFRGDTLFTLAQDVGRATRMATTIRMYLVSTDGCRWVTR